MSADFHAQRETWSEIKHQLLEKHFSLFISKLAGTRSVPYFVGGFAGEGRYGDGSEGSASRIHNEHDIRDRREDETASPW